MVKLIGVKVSKNDWIHYYVSSGEKFQLSKDNLPKMCVHFLMKLFKMCRCSTDKCVNSSRTKSAIQTHFPIM